MFLCYDMIHGGNEVENENEKLNCRVPVNFSELEYQVVKSETWRKGFIHPATFLRSIIIKNLGIDNAKLKRREKNYAKG